LTIWYDGFVQRVVGFALAFRILSCNKVLVDYVLRISLEDVQKAIKMEIWKAQRFTILRASLFLVWMCFMSQIPEIMLFGR
jgi:hypothetical protein